uniref:Small ribosomal subunit protein uS9m n=1 Tax=Neolamprologus brichardi TaxID=32507 RepID=A0A3Q4HWA4_NEOBR
MAASCVRTVGSFLGKCMTCSSSINTVATQVLLSRQVCVSSALCRKNLAAAGPEKFTLEYIQKQVEEYEIGKRYLANMMGEDPENFTQEDIDRSITYLFPSGLFEKTARPLMKLIHFPLHKAVQWGADGRPFHFLFYTGKQSYYSLMHDLYGKILKIEKHQDRLRAKGLFSQDLLWNSEYLGEIKKKTKKPQHDFIELSKGLEPLLSSLYFASKEPDFKKSDCVSFSFSGRRKTSDSSLILRDCGSGHITVNGQDYLQYFPVLQDREQLMFPLQFMGVLGRFNLECKVSGGGRSSQAGALRLAISRALLSFLSEGDGEAMRQAGLLTPDPRVRERKKPGQEGARRKFTWKKR